MHLLLIGPRASGKSSIGRQLATHLDQPFTDLDDLALARFTQATVVEVWRAHGEHPWRTAEYAALQDVLSNSEPQIIALGGGTPMICEARTLLGEQRTNNEIFVVYLRATVQCLAKRLSHNPGDRPSLTGADIVSEMATVLQQRQATYEALADFICDTDDCDEQAVAVLIAHELHRRGV